MEFSERIPGYRFPGYLYPGKFPGRFPDKLDVLEMLAVGNC
jgi:hypothetical protein